MPLPVIRGTSSIGSGRTASFTRPFLYGDPYYPPGGVIVQGSKWYDNGNTGSVRTIRAGHIGKMSSGKVVPAVLGPTTAGYTSGGTELTVSASTALALVQAVGESGTFWLIGGTSAPNSLATVLAVQVTYSAVNTSTGAITITDIGANRASGSLLTTFQPALLGGTGGLTGSPNLGLGVIDRAEGVPVVDADGNSLDVDLAEYGIRGHLNVDNVINWPSNAYIAEVLAYNLRIGSAGLTCNNFYT